MLNDEAIKNRRISVEEANIQEAKVGAWLCHYCSKRFSSESVFMRHICPQKKKAQELASPTGQAGYMHYCEWMKAKKFKQQSMDAFAASRYFRAFTKFAGMAATAGISKPEKFIALMNEAGITPDLWCRDQCYQMYLKYLDERDDPLEQVQSSIEFLMDLAEKEEIGYTDILDHLGPQRVLALITKRKLSPWFLLHSSKFHKVLLSLEKEEQLVFNSAINLGAWIEKLQAKPKLREDIKMIVREIGL